ncbi:glycosyltransferase [Mucilaginibacter sp. E4BP6]|uniref:glycosyltransferase n=1 Tax=Mucilaginibacter sp. E4BP6 TaxID=2723089 RepID=UPI0015CE1EB7|nr:glycosyltransferase [Mucilaginibacter sp. E4BP6]NYE64260.1 GT2 family glycosyltransferase [Mucilaginibacter sp. E4BP6]
MSKTKYKVTIVTVTYGERWELLSQVIKRVLSFKFTHQVIIVDNGSLYNLQAKIDDVADSRIIIVGEGRNTGSAIGYKIGITHAYNAADTDFIWLLDDDNLPAEDCLDSLIECWDELKGDKLKTALYCLRPDRNTDLRIAQGDSPENYYLIPNNILGFSILRLGYFQLRKIKDKFSKTKQFKKFATMPFVPYGGFFFHKNMVDIIGYPNESYFLYIDDADYTYRVTLASGKIWLIPGSRITDIEVSQGTDYKYSNFSSIILDLWDFRMFYRVRNLVYFNSKTSVKNAFLFKLNKSILLNKLRIISIISSKQKEYKKLEVAINDGINGNLGQADADKF